MPPTSDDVYSVFLADLSEKERDRVRRYADKFGIEPTDAVWALMIVLGHYSELYEAVPEKINLRGHFATYTQAAPLFGKIAGRSGIPAHLSGLASEGVIHSDYRLEVA